MSELLIGASSLAHVVVHLKTRRLSYKILYGESAILFLIGLSGLIWFWSKNSLVDESGLFTTLTGSWRFPLQPIDLIFMGLGLCGSTALLDFLTRFYKWDRNSLLAVLPWTFVGTYRYLHEFVWVYSYWTTVNIVNGGFSDSPSGSILLFPAVLTHSYAILFVLFTFFNFIVLLQESRRKNSID